MIDEPWNRILDLDFVIKQNLPLESCNSAKKGNGKEKVGHLIQRISIIRREMNKIGCQKQEI